MRCFATPATDRFTECGSPTDLDWLGVELTEDVSRTSCRTCVASLRERGYSIPIREDAPRTYYTVQTQHFDHDALDFQSAVTIYRAELRRQLDWQAAEPWDSVVSVFLTESHLSEGGRRVISGVLITDGVTHVDYRLPESERRPYLGVEY